MQMLSRLASYYQNADYAAPGSTYRFAIQTYNKEAGKVRNVATGK